MKWEIVCTATVQSIKEIAYFLLFPPKRLDAKINTLFNEITAACEKKKHAHTYTEAKSRATMPVHIESVMHSWLDLIIYK